MSRTRWGLLEAVRKERRGQCPCSLAFGRPSPFLVCFYWVGFSHAIHLSRLLSPASLPICTFLLVVSTVRLSGDLSWFLDLCSLTILCSPSADRASSVILCFINGCRLPNRAVTSCGTGSAFWVTLGTLPMTSVLTCYPNINWLSVIRLLLSIWFCYYCENYGLLEFETAFIRKKNCLWKDILSILCNFMVYGVW